VFPFLYPELELRHESHELLHTISYVKAAFPIVLATLDIRSKSRKEKGTGSDVNGPHFWNGYPK
jgi:hypothetical protein